MMKKNKKSNNNIDTLKEVKDIVFKCVKNLTVIDEPAEFVLHVNKLFASFILMATLIAIVLSLIVVFFYDMTFFEKLKYFIYILIFSPIIFFIIRYLLSLLMVVTDWFTASTKYYKSNSKDIVNNKTKGNKNG